MIRRWIFAVIVMVALAAIGFVLFTGPRHLDLYPDSASSPYKLPWPSGVRYICCQSNRGIVSHRGAEEFAYDFAMPVGSDVCAARGGVVSRIDVSHDGNGVGASNNYVAVDHGDGTTAWYLHLKQGGCDLKVGQHVSQGERIATSGNVGRSMMPHLHFQVVRDGRELERVSFCDVTVDRGVPRMFKAYRSGNEQP
jgi:murein DD-endopeptidase MepM/ murein hydrolase activator NlpD